MNAIRVELFAGAREAATADHVVVTAPAGASFADLGDLLAKQHPALAELARVSRFAVGDCYVPPEETVDATQQVAFIPPVSGG